MVMNPVVSYVMLVMLNKRIFIFLLSTLTKILCYLQEGVGDTSDSYAYDGHRVRKWNMSTGKYGEVILLKYFML